MCVCRTQTGELDSQSKPVQARSVQLEPQAIFINTRNNTVIAWGTTVRPFVPPPHLPK